MKHLPYKSNAEIQQDGRELRTEISEQTGVKWIITKPHLMWDNSFCYEPPSHLDVPTYTSVVLSTCSVEGTDQQPHNSFCLSTPIGQFLKKAVITAIFWNDLNSEWPQCYYVWLWSILKNCTFRFYNNLCHKIPHSLISGRFLESNNIVCYATLLLWAIKENESGQH